MSETKTSYRAIGLMSGTSMDGIDAAVIETDGGMALAIGESLAESYDAPFRERLASVMGGKGPVAAVERELTERHAAAVEALMEAAGLEASDVDVVGFHGQTILHRPDAGRTWQIGDGGLLARRLGVPVVNDFRSADVAAGGQGAPFAPAYHRALTADFDKPVAVLNLGGIANITWIGAGAEDMIAFDTGPANALLDDWVRRTSGAAFDQDGKLAAQGRPHPELTARFLKLAYFGQPPPKSLDRFDFDLSLVEGLSPEDGAATLVDFTAGSVARGLEILPERPKRVIACGGGRRNPVLLQAIATALDLPVETAEEASWQGDFIEAQAFAYLAVRSLKGLALSYPGTTGVAEPTRGGVLHTPASG
jgi:anhydro-N-acetylmuramic acid kinase